jgi:hypothetical protein
MKFEIRECQLPDDLPALADLLHRAYAELAARGLRYLATHQRVEVTERPVKAGYSFVAEAEGAIAAQSPCGNRIRKLRSAGPTQQF